MNNQQLAVVTKKGEAKIIDKCTYVYGDYALCYDHHGVSATTGFDTWNGENNGIFEKYLTNAVNGISGDDIIKKIEKDSRKN